MTHSDPEKATVRKFWDDSPCGESYARGSELRAQFEAQARARYSLEPYIPPFADFPSAKGHDVLEVGVGIGADHLRFAESHPRTLTGVDLTPQAIQRTRQRLDAHGFNSHLFVADAEDLPFPQNSFSLVYTWGVLHHSPDTPAAVQEIHRVLQPGGEARVMIYHRKSVVGYALWLRYALLAGKPFRSLDQVYSQHLESPGTKAYSVADAHDLFSSFRDATVRVQLSFGDLMRGDVGQQHGRRLVNATKRLWPRFVINRFFSNHGLYLLIRAVK